MKHVNEKNNEACDMKILCIGGGPAGLYFAISMKLRNPSSDITVMERNQPGDTFGWGVVFSDETMENLRANDSLTAEEMTNNFAHWDDIEVKIKNNCISSSGHGFIGIGRKKLLNILQDRARDLGVNLLFEVEVEVEDDLGKYDDYDLIIASDGLNSKVRTLYKDEFEVDIDVRKNKFVWLGTKKKFEAFNFIFEKTKHGWVWAHVYQFDEDTATFIVETTPQVYEAFGFDNLSHEENCRLCEEIFAKHLGGEKLLSNSAHVRGSAWINFPRVVCGKWYHKNIILLGDAAHTAHFSIGSGTKLGFEDAIKLAAVLNKNEGSLEERLKDYQEERHLEVLKIQNSARNSTEWFETLDRYLDFHPQQFTYSLLTRSQRVSHENLRLRDKEWLGNMEKWFACEAFGHPVNEPVQPMFTPLKLRDLELKNRIVVSPMSMYSAIDGTPNDFHFVHYGARAQGGAGLLYTEMVNVSKAARITPGCAGLYNDEHVAAWRRIVEYVHTHSDCKVAIQIGHAGPKGSTKVGWEGNDVPLEEGNWEIIAPSPIAWAPQNQIPKEMTQADMSDVKQQFVDATKRAHEAGFDMIELHAAHGYLLSSFISPVSNKRTDKYGGSLENRLLFPLDVCRAMRSAWPQDKPMAVRISATDWIGEAGITGQDAVKISEAFVSAGVDIIDVSAGQTTIEAQPVYGRMFQTPFSDQVRNIAGVKTMAVGNIYEPDHVNSILAAGRADLCCLARPHLMDPNWTLRAAAQAEYDGLSVPKQYQAGFDQLERNLARDRAIATGQVV